MVKGLDTPFQTIQFSNLDRLTYQTEKEKNCNLNFLPFFKFKKEKSGQIFFPELFLRKLEKKPVGLVLDLMLGIK